MPSEKKQIKNPPQYPKSGTHRTPPTAPHHPLVNSHVKDIQETCSEDGGGKPGITIPNSSTPNTVW